MELECYFSIGLGFHDGWHAALGFGLKSSFGGCRRRQISTKNVKFVHDLSQCFGGGPEGMQGTRRPSLSNL